MKQFLFLLVLCLPLLVVSALAAAGTEESEAEILDLSSFELEPYGYTVDDDGTFYVLYEMDDGQVWAVTRSGEEDDSVVAYSFSEDDGIMPLAVQTATAANGKFTFTYETGSYVAIRGIKATYGSFDFALAEMLYNTFLYYDSAIATVVTDSNFQQLLDLVKVFSANFSSVFPSSAYYSYASPVDASFDKGTRTTNAFTALNDNLLRLVYFTRYSVGAQYLTESGDVNTVPASHTGYSSIDLILRGFLGLVSLQHLNSSDMSGAFNNFLRADGSIVNGQLFAGGLGLPAVLQNGFAGLGINLIALKDDFEATYGTSGYIGTLKYISGTVSGSTSALTRSFTHATVQSLLSYLNDNLVASQFSSSDGYLTAQGTVSLGGATTAQLLASGFQGVRALRSGSAIDNQYIFTAFSNSFESDDSVDIESENITYTGLGPLLNGALSHLSWQVGLLNTVFASDTDLEMRQDAEENMNAASDAVLKPGSPGSVSGSDIGNMGDISGSTSALTNTGVGGVSAISAIDTYGSDIWAFFTQETANALDSTVSTASDDEYYTDAFGANMAQFYAAMGLGDYDHSTVVEDEVAAFWADYYGGAE